MEITPEQISAARALLRVEQAGLARRAHVSVITVRRLEGANGRERVTPVTLDGVRHAPEQAGAELDALIARAGMQVVELVEGCRSEGGGNSLVA